MAATDVGSVELTGKGTLLSVRDVTIRFGGVVALDGVSFDVPRTSIFGLIGPNGAGKTTLFNCLSGLYSFQAGAINFEGHSISTMPAHAIAKLGIGRTFQNLAVFSTMTVRDNVMVGGHVRTSSGFLRSALRLPSVVDEERELGRRADDLLKRLRLSAWAELAVGSLPFAVQKRVEIARALAAEPKLLILDEPAAGLNHEELEELKTSIRAIRSELGVTVLLVEHHMGLVMEITDRIVVLNFGRKIAEGSPSEIQVDAAVVEAYLGTTAHV